LLIAPGNAADRENVDLQCSNIKVRVMGIWKTIKAAFGRGTSTPPDARRLNAVDELALSASLGALADEETGWITLSEARALFGEMDQVGKASLVAFAEEREHRSIPEFMLAEGRVYFTRKAA
jgi:hypothetical protein